MAQITTPRKHTEHGIEAAELQCDCGAYVGLWGNTNHCTGCNRMFNAFGQQVTGSLESIDYADAGERWDDD